MSEVSNKKAQLSQAMREVKNVADAVLGREATSAEVIKVTEYIESLNTPKVPAPKKATAVNKKPALVVKKARKKKLPAAYVTNWADHQEWLTAILNGDVHVIQMAEIRRRFPAGMHEGPFANRVRKEAKERGYSTAYVHFNRKDKTVSIQAVIRELMEV